MRRPRPFGEPIYVTRPLLPPLSEYTKLLERIWASRWLSNNGEQHQAFEAALGEFLGARHLSLFNNGTIALIVACQALRVSGEVITTPFTFPATPHVLSWNNVTPVFADIDPETMTLDPARVEGLITNRTTAILGVHVYGMPCDVVQLRSIGERYGLRVIYDGAHAFGTNIEGRPITEFGDATMLSFHATKLFHTAEGGALIVHDPVLKQQIDLLKNFGIKNEHEVMMPGINGKMNELQAALGLLNLRYMETERERRESIVKVYQERLYSIDGIRYLHFPTNVKNSCQYFVIRVDPTQARHSRDQLYELLKEFNIFTRKYFYPLCSEYNCYRTLPTSHSSTLPVAYRVVQEVLCLPLYGDLGLSGAQQVCDAIEYTMKH